ncbi:MAG TPA: DUF6282 family protein [Negativicutes bacterium]|nr:DUF6282 family protein [Negativicutes bacterium]
MKVETTAPANSEVVDLLLRGAIDMHIHGSPDIVPRKLTDAGVVRAAKSAGMSGVILKNHVTPTTSRAGILQELIGNIQVFGGLVLNKAAGGLNPNAVEAELALGAKEIWLPTKSAINEIRQHNGDPGQAVVLTDENGRFRPELHEIMDLIAQKDAILGTGHLEAGEIEKVVALAKERGIKKVLITHPEYPALPGMPVAMQKRLARQGVYFERCFVACTPPTSLSPAEIAAQIRATGTELSIMATDFGQAFNEEPLAAFKRYIGAMLASGISPRDIETMVKKNPAQLLSA